MAEQRGVSPLFGADILAAARGVDEAGATEEASRGASCLNNRQWEAACAWEKSSAVKSRYAVSATPVAASSVTTSWGSVTWYSCVDFFFYRCLADVPRLFVALCNDSNAYQPIQRHKKNDFVIPISGTRRAMPAATRRPT